MRERLMRFGATGVVMVVLAGLLATVGVIGVVGATGGSAASYVPITPCRLFDTRSGPDNVGDRAGAIGEGETVTFSVRGSIGNCVIPSTATGITANLTVVGPSANSFVTLWPADAARPLVSSINFGSGQAPVANGVTVKLSADGKIKAFNLNGTVDIILDVAGYHEPASTGTTVDPTRPVTIDVWTGPGAIEFAAGSIWVAHNLLKKVTRIDPATNQIVAVIDVPTRVGSILFDGSSVWTSGDGGMVKINPATNSVVGVIEDQTSSHGACFDGTSLWQGFRVNTDGASDSWLRKINPLDAAIQGEAIAITQLSGYSLLCVEDRIWWGAQSPEGSYGIGWLDPVTGASDFTAMSDDAQPWYLHFDGSRILYTAFKSYSFASILGIFDLSELQFNSQTIMSGSGLLLYQLNASSGDLWATTGGPNSAGQIMKVDVATGQLLESVNIGRLTAGIAFDGSHLWVTDSQAHTVTKIAPS